MTPKAFRDELARLYAAAHAKGFMSDDLAEAADVDYRTMVKWIGGYACPETSAERTAVLRAIATLT